MSSQPDLFTPIAHARKSDPRTSKDAAASVDNITDVQAAIIRLFDLIGAMTDSELIANYKSEMKAGRIMKQWKASDSGLRTRRKELVDKGLIVDSGKRGKTASGRQTIIWRLA